MLYSTEAIKYSASGYQTEKNNGVTTKNDNQTSHISSVLDLLNLLRKEEISIGKEIRKNVHLKAIGALIMEVSNILTSISTSENLKLTHICILIEGLTSYLRQFGLNPELQKKVIAICANYLDKLALTSTIEAFRVNYQKELEKTLLFFALVDERFSFSMLDSSGVNFTKKKSWLVQQPYEFNAENNQPLTTKTITPGLDTDESGSFITAVFSQGGFILSKLDTYTEEFVKHAVACKGTSFNIGSGFGIPERIALLLGAEKIICNDICTEHLDIIRELTPPNYHPKLSFARGSFPDEVDLPNNSIKLIGIFRVLHFLEPDLIIQAIRRIHELLEPNGTLILSAETPYLGNWQGFISEYEHRVKNKDPWPGYISDTSIYETAGYSKKLPSKMHFLDVATLTRVLTENGFTVEQCSTFNRATTFPQNILLDGRESVGAIARKSKISYL